MTTPSTYRDRLIAARQALGLSRGQMAKRLLTPRQIYEQWENGTPYTPGVAVVAAEALASNFHRREAASQQLRFLWPRRDAVAALLDAGLKPKDIAEQLGLTIQTVYQHLMMIRRSRGQRVKRVTSAEVARLADGTRSAAEIAAALSITRVAVAKHLSKLRRSDVDAHVRGELSERLERNAEIVRLFCSERKSIGEIAAAYQLSPPYIQQILRRANGR